MRKRLIIGAIAATIIGLAAYVFRPWESELERHKRQYLVAMRHAYEDGSMAERVTARINNSTGIAVPVTSQPDKRRISLDYLLAKNFLVTVGFSIKSGEPQAVAEKAFLAAHKRIPEERLQYAFIYWDVVGGTRDSVALVSQPQDVPAWKDIIAEADLTQAR